MPEPESLDEMNLKRVLEALLFASQKPLAARDLAVVLKSAAEVNPEDEAIAGIGKSKLKEVESALAELKADYEGAGLSFQLVEHVGGWQVVSAPEYSPWVRQLFPENRPARLSAPALETLAIIAYRQPITRADLEAVRGVNVDGVMQTLLDRSLVRIAGRAEVPGRPLLYETTQTFMEHFGLRSLDELPNSEELRQIKLPTAPVAEEQPAPADTGELPLDAAGGADDPAAGSPTGDEDVSEPAAEAGENQRA